MSAGPGCPDCRGAGWVRTPKGDAFDACGRCARRAEREWQLAQPALKPARELEDAA